MKTDNQECCPEFDPGKWDKKTFNWDHKLFLKETMPTVFHIPFPSVIGKKTMKMHLAAEKNDALISDMSEALLLFRDPSAFKSEIYYSVSKEVPGIENTSVSGTFAARVFDGPYNSVPRFINEMNQYLTENGRKAKDFYIHYAYCPGCAKKYGHNYMILFAQL